MNRVKRAGLFAVLLIGSISTGCAPPQPATPVPALPPEYTSLPDTVICVVDRASPTGLREIQAKVGESGVVLYVDGQIRPLEAVHPVAMIAGYAGREGWLTRGDPIALDGSRYMQTGGERRIGVDLLRRAGEFEGILMFAGVDDPPPADALYVPTAPGCIFQAYVREDLLRR
jgi:hypothetical protein